MPKSSDLPAKITVSRLKKGLLDEEKIKDADVVFEKSDKEDPVPLFVLGTKAPTSAEKGTAMHMFMQFCDFERCVEYGVEKEAQRLLDEGFIDKFLILVSSLNFSAAVSLKKSEKAKTPIVNSVSIFTLMLLKPRLRVTFSCRVLLTFSLKMMTEPIPWSTSKQTEFSAKVQRKF